MKTQQIYTRHHWLKVKQTIGRNTAPSFLNTGCEQRYSMYKADRYNTQPVYFIDLLGIVDKLSIFFKGFTSFFAISVQTDWQKKPEPTSSKLVKSM